MKMKYERPVMKAELFQANQYVAACTISKNSQLNVIWNAVAGWGNWASTFIGDYFLGYGYWQNDDNYITSHSFEGTSVKVDGGYSDGGYYWTVNSTSDNPDVKSGTYYLQYSDVQQSNNRMYQLWYETNETAGLQNVHERWLPIIGNQQIGNGNDTRVAYVSVTEQQNSVVEGS